MTGPRAPKVALVIPTVELGAYWKPVLDHMARDVEELRLFTAMPWRGAGEQDFWPRGHMTQVGDKRRVTSSGDADSDYGGGVMVLSPKISTAVGSFRPDVVIVSGFSLWTILMLGLRSVMRWKVLLLWEGSSPRVDHLEDPRRLALRRRLAVMADAVMTNSPGGREYLVNHVGVSGDHVWQVPYMVPDPATLCPPDHPRPDRAGLVEILSVGRLEERKGNASLLQAVAALPAEVRDRVRLRFIGDGVEAEPLRAQAEELGLTPQVSFDGWVPYAELGAHMAAADLLAFLTHEDTWGMVALEAMAVGTPVLCSRWAGAHAMVDPALVVDPHDITEVAAAIASLMADPAHLSALGDAAAALMASHLPQHAAGRLLRGARWAATGTASRV